MRPLRAFLLIAALPFVLSCAAVSHMDEALVLQQYSREKDAQADEVAARDHRFEELLNAVARNDSLVANNTKTRFQARFGAPILVEREEKAGTPARERWLYRYATRYFDSPKVYVTFDENDRLMQIERRGADKSGGP